LRNVIYVKICHEAKLHAFVKMQMSRNQSKTFRNLRIFLELNNVALAELPSNIIRQTLVSMGVRWRGGGKAVICPSLEIEIKDQLFPETPKSAALFQINDLILALTVYLPVSHSHCTSARFIVIVSCSDELAVHSCLLLCLQRRVAKDASGLFYCWSLLRNNNMATNLQRFTLYSGGRRFVAWDCWTQTLWQVMQRDSDCW